MRVTPLICWSCSTWFTPKTKRKTKFCCNACRQQHFLGIQHGYPNLVLLYWKDQDDRRELETIIQSSCKENKPKCVECLFENNYETYCDEVFKRGRDKFGKSAQEWLSEK